jgi:hypothetical protein
MDKMLTAVPSGVDNVLKYLYRAGYRISTELHRMGPSNVVQLRHDQLRMPLDRGNL